MKTTLLQKRAVKLIVAGKHKTMKSLMLDAGYSEATATHPKTRLLDKAGVQELLRNSGLDMPFLLDELKQALHDAKGKDKARLLDLGFKLTGAYNNNKSNLNINIDASATLAELKELILKQRNNV